MQNKDKTKFNVVTLRICLSISLTLFINRRNAVFVLLNAVNKFTVELLPSISDGDIKFTAKCKP